MAVKIVVKNRQNGGVTCVVAFERDRSGILEVPSLTKLERGFEHGNGSAIFVGSCPLFDVENGIAVN